MILQSEKSTLSGPVEIPASKSHTIRAVAIATLAHGRSEIANPLDSADTRACVHACRALGAEIKTRDAWIVKGVGGRLRAAEDEIDASGGDKSTWRPPVLTCTTCGQHYFVGWVKDFEFTAREPGGGQLSDQGSFWEAQNEKTGGRRVVLRSGSLLQMARNDWKRQGPAADFG